MSTRTGKIARLPRYFRDKLNQRLQDGEPGNRLVDWLNSLPEVREVLAAEFCGREISEQNLSEWKQGGYRDWERHEASCALVRELTEQTDDLAEEADGLEVSHRLASVLSVELARVADAMMEQATDPEERWRRLRDLLHELARLRQEDRKAGWLLMEREKRNRESAQRIEAMHKREWEEEKDKILAPLWAKAKLGRLGELFGGGENGRKVAAFVLEVKHDLPLDSLVGGFGQRPVKPDQTKSNPIKPNQTECQDTPSSNGS